MVPFDIFAFHILLLCSFFNIPEEKSLEGMEALHPALIFLTLIFCL